MAEFIAKGLRKMTTDNLREQNNVEDMSPAMSLQTFITLAAAVAAGALLAAVALPAWLPGLSDSLLGAAPQAYWYLSRASAIVSYILIWLSMALGLMITNKLARVWPGGPGAFDLHQHASLLGLIFAMFHGLILLGDRYINFSLAQVVIPFASVNYSPFWVGLGQLSFYGLALVGLSFYVRKAIGHRVWRLLHTLSFSVFIMALAHGVASGSDSGVPVISAMYWGTAGSLVFLTVYRVLVSGFAKKRKSRAN